MSNLHNHHEKEINLPQGLVRGQKLHTHFLKQSFQYVQMEKEKPMILFQVDSVLMITEMTLKTVKRKLVGSFVIQKQK